MPDKIFTYVAPDFSLGLSLESQRNRKPGEISSGQSIRYERGSGLYTGPGFRSVAQPVADVRVDGMKEALTYPALWIKTGTAIRYSEDAVTFYDTGVTVTAARYTTFTEQGNGDMYAANITDAPLRFTVGRASVAIAATDTTITFANSDIRSKFAASGTVFVRGDSISYTGVSGATLTGVTGIQAGGHPVDSLVVQSSNPSTWDSETGIASMNYQSRLCIAGRTGLEHVFYASAPEDAANPAFFYDFDANGTTSKIFPAAITGLISGLGRAYVFMDKAVHELQGFDVATGALISVPISETYGAYNPKCIVDMDGVIAFLGQRRVMPITLALAPDATTAPFLGQNFDERIRPWLETHDDSDSQADAFLKWDSTLKILKIGAVVDGALQVYGYDAQDQAFFPMERRNLSVSSMFLGKSYFGDRDNGRIYEDDTSRTNNGVAIVHHWSTGRIEYDQGRQEMQADRLEFEGYMASGTSFLVRVYINGATDASAEFSLTDSLITSQSGVALGSRGVGTTTIGSLDTSEIVYPYKANLLLAGLMGEDFRLYWEISGEGMYLSLNSMKFTAYPFPYSSRTYS